MSIVLLKISHILVSATSDRSVKIIGWSFCRGSAPFKQRVCFHESYYWVVLKVMLQMLYSAWRPNQVSFSGVWTAASNSAAVVASLSRVASVSALHYGRNFPSFGQRNKMSYFIPNKEKITHVDNKCQLLQIVWFEMSQTSISSKCFVFEFSLT